MDRLLADPRSWGLMLAATLTVMSNATITPSLPGLEAAFADDPLAPTITRLLITAPSLLVAVVAPLAGVLADRLGRRRPLLWGLAIYAVAGTAGLYLPTLETILASRLALGLGVALIMTAQAALVGDYFDGPARGRLMGYQMAATNLGGLAFVTTAGLLAASDPRLPFAIYGLAVPLFPLLWRILPEPPRHGSARGPAAAPDLPADPGWRMVAGVMAGAAGLTFVIFYAVPTQLPYHLRGIGLEDPRHAGTVMGAMMASAAVMSVISGLVRLGRIATPVLGYLMLALGFAAIALAHGLAMAMAGAALIGAGLGFCMPTFITTALNAAPARYRGLVSGLITSAIFLGQFLSPLASTPLVAHLGYAGAFLTGAAGFGLLAVALVAILRRQAPALHVKRTAE
ncbi:putative 3-hydroxyphenylpropionic transporter MhpT [Paracoccus haematequi]|uniref:Putative 3-hydroxyphenylpropionic transporter MhpT n=1 Tax=Paracoccus haematequi TaxID=2491866 RepID=A0A447ILQ7_9RHOB|nr:MFS transporter [Paracoccus haematequi]VDS08482.1 putative 3-hydroxyphenylpropionic transporter MhpT [Paracoccus haematequi]